MDGWIYSTKRKVHQRTINRLIRKINKAIEDDELWQGRFFARQNRAEFWKYEDNSGGELSIYLRFYDKKDMKYQEFYGTSCELSHWEGSRLWLAMNYFITEITSTWKEGHPGDHVQDFRPVPNDYVVKNSEPYFDYPMSCWRF